MTEEELKRLNEQIEREIKESNAAAHHAKQKEAADAVRQLQAEANEKLDSKRDKS